MIGDTTICKWKDNKAAAYSVGGDDSLKSQITFAIPEMTKRGIFGTWWINCERDMYLARESEWIAAAKAGHDFANHTLHHKGATDVDNADWEIGEEARRIWAANPAQKLQLFLNGGGTTWNITNEQRALLLKKYFCVDDSDWEAGGRNGKSGGIEDPSWDLVLHADDYRRYVDAAIEEGSWHVLGLHGIGPSSEWGGETDGEAFISLCDYLAKKKDTIWADSHLRVHKYIQERNNSTLSVFGIHEDRARIRLISSLDTSAKMYDYPLTLRTCVPDEWKKCTVIQNRIFNCYPVTSGVVQYYAIPNAGEIVVNRGEISSPV